MTKYTRYADIPQFTRSGSYECDFAIHRVVFWVVDQMETEGLNIDPDFQRGHVWTEAQQIAWLEFILRGGRTGRVLYFNAPWWGRNSRAKGEFVIVDGKQRLEALRRFSANEIPVFGTYSDDYKDKPRSAVNTIKINVNDLATRAEVLQWYLEMNTGGVVHTSDEIERVRGLLSAESKPGRKRRDQ